MDINYITKKQMINQFKKNYFGLTIHNRKKEKSKIYIRSDLPDCVKESVLAHEKAHVKAGKNKGELIAWVAGLKGNWIGFFMSIVLSLRPSRLKMYPELVSILSLITIFLTIVYISEK